MTPFRVRSTLFLIFFKLFFRLFFAFRKRANRKEIILFHVEHSDSQISLDWGKFPSRAPGQARYIKLYYYI